MRITACYGIFFRILIVPGISNTTFTKRFHIPVQTYLQFLDGCMKGLGVVADVVTNTPMDISMAPAGSIRTRVGSHET
jgi:hypothetical protein